MTGKKVIIVGAGMGGLATAIRLAAAGYSVEVFEKNERVGGKLNLLERDGYRWDTGPSLITMPFVYHDLFAAAGKKVAEYITLKPVEPVCRYFYPDGTRFDASDSTGKMTAELERLSPPDVRNYFRFMAYSRRLYDLTADAFLFNGINNWRDFLKLRPRDALQIDPFRTVHQAVQNSFKDARLVQLFDRYATYNGSSPFRAPATLNIIPYVELGMGGWYVEGGLYELGQAYLRLARELGVEVHLNCGVEQILTEKGRVNGVRLVNGREVSAELVVANTDVTYTNHNLLGLKKRQGQNSLEPSCSGFVLFLGVDRQYEQLAHHNIMFSRDYRSEFDFIFEKKKPAPDPTVYICWTGKSDPQHAPPGKSNLFVLINAPYLSEAFDWETPEATRAYRDLVVRQMEEFGLENLSQHIEVEEVMTPLDLTRRYNADRGAIYGLSSNNRFSAFLRPPNRSQRYRGLYFVGGSTHPGGGVPLVTLSARIVTNLILKDDR
ncbi:MAG TPA: phytoene desaturase family protein [Chloroflexia bacterium]|nr:phytoene desaturase family protein [Chloroflexia bacterium]